MAAGARTWWPWLRVLGGAAVLAVLLWRLDAGPFLDGIRSIDATTVTLALGIGLVTTMCSAWRWTLVARGLGLVLPMRAAVSAYYRSQFLNTTLPGGVLGDVHRGVLHGRDVNDPGRALRAVAGERIAGQFTFVVVALGVLVVLPSPVQAWIPVAAVLLLLASVVAWGLARVAGRQRRFARILRAVCADTRAGLLPRDVWPKILLASLVVAAGYTATFVVAVRATGTNTPLLQLLPMAVLVLLAMVIPLNIGGWGPREGMAAWVFAASGLDPAHGLAAAVLFGVLAIVATLPGLAVLIAGLFRRRVGPVDLQPAVARA